MNIPAMIRRLLSIPDPEPPAPTRDEPALFTIHGGWGHHVEWFGDFSDRRVWGHLPDRPMVDDYLEADMQSGRKAIFRFVAVDYPGDPHDMFFGTVEDMGYRDELDCEALRIPSEPEKSWFL